MATVRTGFLPIEHGFRFPNLFEYVPPWPFGDRQGRLPYSFGLCGGMCFAALDYWHAGIPVPMAENPPQPGTSLYGYLVRRQVASMVRPEVLLRLTHWVFSNDLEIAPRTAREFGKLRQALERGIPMTLVLVRTHRWETPVDNHQVLAVGYEFDELTQRARIYMYDPNYPCEEIDLDLDLSGPEQGIGLWHQKGDTTRGFFVQAHHPRVTGLPRDGPTD